MSNEEIYFSPQSIGFYTREIHGNAIPSDAIEIPKEVYFELLAGQASGKQIVPGDGGMPRLVDPTPLTAEDLRALTVIEIDNRREEGLAVGVEINGTRYHSDDRFLTELLGMIMGYQVGIYTGTQKIRTIDNRTVELDLAQLTELALAVGAHRKAVYAASWAEKDAL